MITAAFKQNEQAVRVTGLTQWDYGQVLNVQGLMLPTAVEIHFALEGAADSVTRVAMTKDGTTKVTIPDSMLEQNRAILAYIYLSTPQEGETVRKITMPVTGRAKPEAFDAPGDAELFREAIEAVNASAAEADKAEKEAEGWAHGREDMPDRDKDNARYYAGKASDFLKGIPGEVEAGKENIDRYVKEKEASLKGETGNVFFAAFKVISGRLKMYSDPEVDKVRFRRNGSRLTYRLEV